MSAKIRVGVAIWQEGASEPPRVSSFTKGLLSLVARWVGGGCKNENGNQNSYRSSANNATFNLLHIIAVHYKH